MNKAEPLILVFEGMNDKSLDKIKIDLKEIFKGTRFEHHVLLVNRRVYGIDNANADKLDEIIQLLKNLNKVLKNG